MGPIEELTKKQLMEGILSESWEDGSEDYALAVNQLLSAFLRSESLIEILELTNSDIDSVRCAGAWIAGEQGRQAISIFDELKELLYSENKRIRYEIMDCYLNCASSGGDVLGLVKCVEDDVSNNRLKAISCVRYLWDEQISSAYDYALNHNDQYCHHLYILKKQCESVLEISEIEEGINTGDSLCKKFYFIAAMRMRECTDSMAYLAEISGDRDIKDFFERYGSSIPAYFDLIEIRARK